MGNHVAGIISGKQKYANFMKLHSNAGFASVEGGDNLNLSKAAQTHSFYNLETIHSLGL